MIHGEAKKPRETNVTTDLTQKLEGTATGKRDLRQADPTTTSGSQPFFFFVQSKDIRPWHVLRTRLVCPTKAYGGTISDTHQGHFVVQFTELSLKILL